MSWFHVALGALAMFALLASWNVPRAGKWIFIASLNYIVSVVYFRLGFEGGYYPPPIVVAFFCDVTCFVIIKQGHERAWEFRTLGVIMMVMTTLDALMFASKVTGFPPMIPMTFYGSLQELLNAVYLLVIGGVGLMDLAHGYGLADRHSGGFIARLNAATQRETQVQKIRLK